MRELWSDLGAGLRSCDLTTSPIGAFKCVGVISSYVINFKESPTKNEFEFPRRAVSVLGNDNSVLMYIVVKGRQNSEQGGHF